MMRIFFLLFTLLQLSHSWANDRTSKRTWLGLMGKKEVAPSYSIWNELQTRLDNKEFTKEQLMVRVGILKELDKKNESGLLYAYVETQGDWEQRLALQHTNTFNQHFSLRHRLEFRHMENEEAESIRFRELVRYQKNKFLIWNEFFFNLTNEDWTGNQILERNRFFIGTFIPIHFLNLELGYMHQYIPRPDTTSYEHVLVANFHY